MKTKKLIGDMGIRFLEVENPQCEIGFSIAPQRQSNGFATEALNGLVSHLFSMKLKKHGIFASVDPNDLASIRVLEKSGFLKEAHFKKSMRIRGVWVDDVILARLNTSEGCDEKS